MKVDNFNLIRSLLRFEDKDDFYFCQIIQRKKDGNEVPSANNGYRTIKSYYIRSVDDFDRRIPAIIQLCEQNNARAYINLNVRNAKQVAMQCSKAYIDLVLEDRANQGHRVYDHCCGITPKRGASKTWIVDVDTKDEYTASLISYAINLCRSGNKTNVEGLYSNVIARIPTLNGSHFITCGFDKSQLKDKILYVIEHDGDITIAEELINEVCNSIKKDNPTLLYFNKKVN